LDGIIDDIRIYNRALNAEEIEQLFNNCTDDDGDGFFAEGTNPATIRFAAKFRNLFHRNPGFIEAIAHDSASILFITAMDEGIDSCTALKNTLQQGNRIFEGATGNTIFDHQGRAEKSLFLMTVKKGRFTEITR
jgi:uncharacterized protein (DUF1697 family)